MADNPAFYELTWPNSDETEAAYGDPTWEHRFQPAEWTDNVFLESIKCPKEPGHQRGGRRLTDLDLLAPSKLGDFVWTWVSECLVSERVRDLFDAAGLTGYSLRSATLTRKSTNGGSELPKFFELEVTGHGGTPHPDCGIRLIYSCQACGLVEYSSFRNGIRVQPDEWDRSDFFKLEGCYATLVSERVRELVEASNPSNCMLIPSERVQWRSLSRPEDVYGN